MSKQQLIVGLERRLRLRRIEHDRAWRLLQEAESGKWPVERFQRTHRDALTRYEECRRILNWVRRAA